jgi:hypothetical protein
MKVYIIILIIALSFIWCGLVIGISFIEAPLKFKAPEVTLKIGVGIGMLVFKAINTIEIVLAMIIIGLLLFSKPKSASQMKYFALGIAVSLLVLQSVWLLPSLQNSAKALLEERPSKPNFFHHKLFVIAEIVKVLSLIFFAGNFLFKQLNNTKNDYQ